MGITWLHVDPWIWHSSGWSVGLLEYRLLLDERIFEVGAELLDLQE